MVANYRSALASARGEFFVNLDGDDYFCDPSFIRKAVGLLRENPGVVAVIGGQRIHDQHGRQLSVQRQTDKSYEIVAGEELFLASIAGRAQVIPHLATVVRTSVARSIGYYGAEILNTDLHSVRRLFLEGDVALIDNICGIWSYNNANASMSFSPSSHTRNILSLTGPYEAAMQSGKLAVDQTRLETALTVGVNAYIRDIYAICLRTDRPVRNALEFRRELQLSQPSLVDLRLGRWLLPPFHTVRNMAIRLALGQTLYRKLAEFKTRARRMSANWTSAR